MRGKTENIGIIINKIMLRKGVVNTTYENKIASILNEYFDLKEMSKIKIYSMKNNILKLKINSTSLMYEINYFKKDQILKDIKNKVNYKINKIDICLDEKNGN